MRFETIAIERQYASGGREVGELTAKKLGIPCYGEEILKLAAERYGFAPNYMKRMEETATSSFLYSLYMLSDTNGQGGGPISGASELAKAESEIILEIAAKGPAVFVGRCAGFALEQRRSVLRAFIHADWECRVKRAVDVYDVDPKRADQVLKKADKRRAGYFNAYTDRRWDDWANYHLVLDSGKLGTSGCAELLAACVGREL